MRTFKLITSYPGSPEIGMIIKPKFGDGKLHDYYWNHYWFNPLEFPDYWEEVVEPRTYTEAEMFRAVNNWGLCKVEIERINKFLSQEV